MPVIADIDFGHTQPMIIFPVGGEIKITALGETVKIEVVSH